jgi:plasmid stabilization system protein ParE
VKARIEPQARDELREAKRWYDEQKPGLGAELLDAVRTAVGRIQQSPHGFPLYAGFSDIRRAVVERFPYIVIYLVRNGVIRILVVAHQRQRPGKTRRAAASRRGSVPAR